MSERTTKPELNVERLCWTLAQDLYQVEKYRERHSDEQDHIIAQSRRSQITEVLREIEAMGIDTVDRAYAHTRGDDYPGCDEVDQPPWQDTDDDSVEFQRFRYESAPPDFTVINGHEYPLEWKDE